MRDLALVPDGGELRLEAGRVVRVHPRQLADLAVERRGEEHRLPFPWKPGDDPVDLRLEAHVEHAVGLVQDEDPNTLERHRTPLEQVVQPAGRGHEDVCRLRALGLRMERNATVDGRHLQVLRAGDHLDVLGHLRAELTGGDEDEGGRTLRVGLESLDDRDSEGERLARTGRRLREDVAPGQQIREHERLDRERCVDIALRERLSRARRHAKLVKRLLHF